MFRGKEESENVTAQEPAQSESTKSDFSRKEFTTERRRGENVNLFSFLPLQDVDRVLGSTFFFFLLLLRNVCFKTFIDENVRVKERVLGCRSSLLLRSQLDSNIGSDNHKSTDFKAPTDWCQLIRLMCHSMMLSQEIAH